MLDCNNLRLGRKIIRVDGGNTSYSVYAFPNPMLRTFYITSRLLKLMPDSRIGMLSS